MTQKLDRRTRYTRSVIKQSFLELLQKYPFPKVTVTAICKKAEITRATFYLHYMDIYALLDAILEEALHLSENTNPDKSLADFLYQASQSNESASFIKNNYTMLPVCQRIADSPCYQALFSDKTLGPYILEYIFTHEKTQMISFLQNQLQIDATLAENLYLFLVSGAFTINQQHKWKKDESWFQIQAMLLRLIYHGIQGLKK